MRTRQNAAIATFVTAALTMPIALGARPAQADEVADLKANQQLLQQRIDQLAQSGNVGAGPVLGTTVGGPVNVQMMGGSFPRSFLIPGTDTSIRVGGEIRMLSLFWVNGGNPGVFPSTNAGTTGQLNNIPLTGTPPGSAQAINRVRGEDVFTMSPQQSKLSVETRTPTAWGEARSFIEFDAAGNPTAGSRPLSTADSLQPRFRYAYGTLGPLLFGQANSNFNDSDAGMESLQFGGMIGGGGPSRVPQIRWTQPLGEWGLLGALSISAESPETEIWSPGAGVYGNNPSDPPAIPAPTGASLAALLRAQPGATTTVANPLKATAPDLVAAWYIAQPWGHVDFAAVVRPMERIDTPFGRGIDRTYVGFGGAFSGDFKPRWFGWDKDFFTWNVVGGQAMGRYLYAGSGSSIGLVSNLTGNTLVDGTTLVKPTSGYSGNIAYRHVWTPTLRSNAGVGVWHLDIPGLNGQVCPAASQASASGGCGLNKRLWEAQVNLIWQPVSFIDFGIEYTYGLRKVFSGQMGNENVITNRMRLRF